MAKNLTQNNIDFTVNTAESVGGFATKRTNSNLISDGKYSTSNKQALIDGGYESSGGFSVNAVDIDWNGAQVSSVSGNATLNTTGDLLKWASSSFSTLYTLMTVIEQNTGKNYVAYPTSSGNPNYGSSGQILVSNGSNGVTWQELPSSYSLPLATSSSLGGIKLGYSQNNKKYPVQLANEQAFVEVPWTDTIINAAINTSNKSLIVSDSDNNEKFKIVLSEVDITNNGVNTGDKAAAIQMIAGNNNVNTVLPGFTIDSNNRKIIYTNTVGQQTANSITFGSLEIVGVIENQLSRTPNNRIPYVTSDPDLEIEDDLGQVNYEIFIGDLILAISEDEVNGETVQNYHLYVCNQLEKDNEYNNVNKAFFTDLGVFPGNNFTLTDDKVNLKNPFTVGDNNVTTVQEALNYALYYEVVNPADVATLED